MLMPCVSLFDHDARSQADILVGFGFNCYRFQTHFGSQCVPIIWSEDGFETGRCRPSGSGIPLLFPFPGRIQGTALHWQGERYPLQPGDGRGNAIHGFVLDRPWRIVDQSPRHVSGQFQASLDAPELRRNWPADYRLTVTYRLHAHTLTADFLVENPGPEPLPFGLGTHPYFHVPLASGSRAADCRIVLPVSSQWELNDMNATGQRQPLAATMGWQQGMRLGDVQLDCVFGELHVQCGRCTARIEDPASGLWVAQDWDAAFRECVVYTPGHRQAICIEPYTCVPDCFRLQPEGIDAGLRVLQPGESFRTDVRIEAGQRD